MNILQKILVTLFGHTWSPYFTGILPDTRLASEKIKDYMSEERTAPTAPADPFGNPQMASSLYPYVNQFGTSSCVPHAVGLGLAIERKNQTGNYSAVAPIFPYRLRSNYAGEGSIPANIYAIYKNTGAPLEATLPTPQTEQQANMVTLTQQMYNEAAIFKGNLYFKLGTPNDIVAIAQIAQEGHAVALCLFATYDEYAKQIPTVDNPSLKQGAAEVQHEVCVIPYSGFTLNGTRYVCIQDSAWFGGFKFRYLSENFIKARVTESRYWTSVQVLASGVAPKYTFTQPLNVGMRNEEVKQMQLLLISEGLLPTDCATGFFGGLTLAAVKAFQERYASEVLLPAGLTAPSGFWGNYTIKKANQLCS